MSAVVYLGPSLPVPAAAEELEAEYLPPIARGDLAEILRRPVLPRAIGIIDGKFLSTLCVSPKEVLEVVDRGIKVFGSSSMGALRAAECHHWGMVGVGKIFEAYRTGEVDADDEVAIAFDEETGAPVSEPMVNLRVAVRAALESGVVRAATAEAFLQAAKDIYFPQRTARATLLAIRGRVPEDEHAALSRYFATDAPDAKADDARLLLRTMRDYLAGNQGQKVERALGVHRGGVPLAAQAG
ncbi:TfuA-like protein [Micromonospora sp. NPDC049460]|uniref:TfuA-like protein n=1 Tax=Micromonospora sp. NPDC049460 TaxID=3364272 RepID=UPI0037872D18